MKLTPEQVVREAQARGLVAAVSGELLVREYCRREEEAWGPQFDATEALMQPDLERGSPGGLMGSTPELMARRAAMISWGLRQLYWERSLGGNRSAERGRL